jgi:hypothetical protein
MSQHLGDPARHFFMTRGVARVMGVNLGDALNSGQLEPQRYADLVTRCRGCALVEACEEWLAAQTLISTAPPPGCCNSNDLCRLRDLH